MSACSEHWRSKAVELPVAERRPEEPGAVEHLKVKAAFSTAPPEHRGVVMSSESALWAAAAVSMSNNYCWSCLKVSTNPPKMNPPNKKTLLILCAVSEELEKLCDNAVTPHSRTEPHSLFPSHSVSMRISPRHTFPVFRSDLLFRLMTWVCAC